MYIFNHVYGFDDTVREYYSKIEYRYNFVAKRWILKYLKYQKSQKWLNNRWCALETGMKDQICIFNSIEMSKRKSVKYVEVFQKLVEGRRNNLTLCDPMSSMTRYREIVSWHLIEFDSFFIYLNRPIFHSK